ncbi:MAG: DUF881 domain-containing protein [Tissierellia bacterium]|nr:DUF881 domain-containing protein [Tissierellia bacterium]
MNKIIKKTTLLLLAGFVSFSTVMQIKSKPEKYTHVTFETIKNAVNELGAIKQENQALLDMENLNKARLEQLIEASKKGSDNLIKNYKAEIEERKIELGYYDVKGPGIIIKMYDNDIIRPDWYDVNFDVVHDGDIQIIINDLRLAGAEAISVNDERLTSKSGIQCGGPTIWVNDVAMATPFYIKAIGDPNKLYASVTAPNTYGDSLKEIVGLEASVVDEITIKAYSGDRNFKYAKPIKEDS